MGIFLCANTSMTASHVFPKEAFIDIAECGTGGAGGLNEHAEIETTTAARVRRRSLSLESVEGVTIMRLTNTWRYAASALPKCQFVRFRCSFARIWVEAVATVNESIKRGPA